MRINRSILLNIVDDTVASRIKNERGILAIYLCGALLGDDFILGGTADIDLGFVHIDTPELEREIVRLTDEVHLDIAHYPQKLFQQTRNLRLHPWLGPTIFECKVVYDPHHFMDFTQASVRGQFNRDDFVFQRSRQRLEQARQVWQSFNLDLTAEPQPVDLLRYLQAVEQAVNAVANLSGAPLTERRMLPKFKLRAESVGRPGLYPALLGMLGAPHIETGDLQAWLDVWQTAFDSLSAGNIRPRLDPARRLYYRRAFESMLQSDHPAAVLWPLLRTWTLAASLHPPSSPAVDDWKQACHVLGLMGRGFDERVQALDAFLDMTDEVVDAWIQERGG